MKHCWRIIVMAFLLVLNGWYSRAQGEIFVNMAMVDGVDLTPDNLLSFQIQSGLKKSSRSLIRGTIKFRNSDLRITYRFEYDLQPGMNTIPVNTVKPQFEYSSQALRELFERYKKLPEGIYEYCISVKPDYNLNESTPGKVYDECVYHKSQDVFLINLIDPENGAKIYEYNPMLSWTVNYPFASELKYRIRVAEMKEGQNPSAAINRNNPVYDEKNLAQMSIVYPVYGKPLQKNQPYAWTVDAYYKGLLLGGAEPWKFTIIEDSLLVAVATDQSYYDFTTQTGNTKVYGIDTLKLKYKSYASSDTLRLELITEEGKQVSFKTTTYPLKPGTNYIDLDFPDKATLKHLKTYVMKVTTGKNATYSIPFIYVNPLYIKK